MDFSLTDEERAIRDTARQFITKEVMPLEQEVLLRERRHQPGLELSELRELQQKAKFTQMGRDGRPRPQTRTSPVMIAARRNFLLKMIGNKKPTVSYTRS